MLREFPAMTYAMLAFVLFLKSPLKQWIAMSLFVISMINVYAVI